MGNVSIELPSGKKIEIPLLDKKSRFDELNDQTEKQSLRAEIMFSDGRKNVFEGESFENILRTVAAFLSQDHDLTLERLKQSKVKINFFEAKTKIVYQRKSKLIANIDFENAKLLAP